MSGGRAGDGGVGDVRVGLIGAGRWAGLHREALQQLGTDVAAVLVSSDASVRRVEADWGVPAYADADAFLASGAMDAVIIASPNHLHAPQARRALQAGLHVLLEKPMALTVEDAAAVRAEAEAAGRVLAVGHEIRTFAWAKEAKRLLDAGALGTPRHVRIDLWRRPYRAGAGGWKADPAKVGSSILEEPIHYLDLAAWWLGRADALQAFATSRAGREGAWENLDVRVWAGEAQASVTRSIAAWGHRVEVALVGDEGAYLATWAGTHDADPAPRVEGWLHRGADRDAPPEGLDLPQATGHAFDLPTQTAAFLAAVRGEGAPIASGADGVEAVRWSLAAQRSLEAGEAKLEL